MHEHRGPWPCSFGDAFRLASLQLRIAHRVCTYKGHRGQRKMGAAQRAYQHWRLKQTPCVTTWIGCPARQLRLQATECSLRGRRHNGCRCRLTQRRVCRSRRPGHPYSAACLLKPSHHNLLYLICRRSMSGKITSDGNDCETGGDAQGPWTG